MADVLTSKQLACHTLSRHDVIYVIKMKLDKLLKQYTLESDTLQQGMKKLFT